MSDVKAVDMTDTPMDLLTAALSLGTRLWNQLTASENALDLRRGVFELSDEEARAIVLASVASFTQQRLGPDEYADWWTDPAGAETP